MDFKLTFFYLFFNLQQYSKNITIRRYHTSFKYFNVLQTVSLSCCQKDLILYFLQIIMQKLADNLAYFLQAQQVFFGQKEGISKRKETPFFSHIKVTNSCAGIFHQNSNLSRVYVQQASNGSCSWFLQWK